MLPIHQIAFSLLVVCGYRTVFPAFTKRCFTNKLQTTCAVRKGVEPLSTDRQSAMLAVTPTNLKELAKNKVFKEAPQLHLTGNALLPPSAFLF